MQFEYDPAKSKSNREKHGIDFDQARNLWMDEKALIVPARTDNEPRNALIGQCMVKIWTCIFTKRSERIRIISVRRSRDGEKEKYHNH
ncbi:MAG: BrnT family toxin [Verrucomicrobia bacterium]|nr:BrnT family toxin [Verrucomicrobiota bacterium]MCH8527187.1 BrnT family toxin [Kiritimatiellia bacterium]